MGYFGTNTAEIAKRAGVSTGIVYGYFKDKRDILLDVLAIYIQNAFSPILEMLDKISPPVAPDALVKDILDLAIKVHEKNAKIHEALHSMQSMDAEVNARFIQLEDDITVELASKLASLGFNVSDLNERAHFAMDIAQSFSHEFIFDHHPYIDYVAMRKIVENTLVSLFV